VVSKLPLSSNSESIFFNDAAFVAAITGDTLARISHKLCDRNRMLVRNAG